MVIPRYLPIVILLLLSSAALAQDTAENDCIYYFYGRGCEECSPVTDFVAQLQQRYPALDVHRFEVYYSGDNLVSLQQYYAAYRVPEEEQKVPVVFMPGSYFIGANSITSLLEGRIQDNTDANCPTLQSGAIGIIGEGAPKNVLETLTFAKVTGAALRNTFSLPALALFLLVVLYGASIPFQEHWLKKGFLLLASIYAAYLLFGVGLFSWLLGSSLAKVVLKILGLAGIFLSLVIIKDFIGTLRLLLHTLPEKPFCKKTAAVLLSYPGIFMLGFAVSLFTFRSATDVLLMLRGLFAGGVSRVVVFPLTLYYLLVFVLPLLVLVIGLYFIRLRMEQYAERKIPRDDRKTDAWKRHVRKLVNFGLGITALVLGIVLLFA